MEATINHYQSKSFSQPGLTLSEKLTELGMGSKEFPVRVDKPEKTIAEVLGGKNSIAPEMEVKFGEVLKIPNSCWLKGQRRYDDYLARTRFVEAIDLE